MRRLRLGLFSFGAWLMELSVDRLARAPEVLRAPSDRDISDVLDDWSRLKSRNALSANPQSSLVVSAADMGILMEWIVLTNGSGRVSERHRTNG